MKNAIIGIRLRKEDKDLLEKVCQARGEDISDFVRRAIYKELAELSYFPEEAKKALGLMRNVSRLSREGSNG